MLSNDYDPDGQEISAVLVTGPTHAVQFELRSDGSFDYMPPAGFVGDDAFSYRVSDGMDVSEVVTTQIGVYNNPPVAVDDTGAEYLCLHDSSLEVSDGSGVLLNDYDPDGDPITAVLESPPAHAAAFSFNTGGGFYYQPEPGWVGTDTFTYRASDGIDTGNVATAAIGVMNMAPVAEDDLGGGDPYIAVYNTLLEVDEPGVLWNDWDWDGDYPLTASRVDPPAHGSVDLHADGSFEYMPDMGYLGGDTFTYTANDAFDASEPATVSIAVVRPIPDIDTDSDNDGFVETFSQQEDDEEMNAPGKLLFYNADDDNQNRVPDREETGIFHDQSGQPMADDDLKEVELSVDGVLADLTGFTLQLTDPYHLELWASPCKESLQMSYTIGTDQIPTWIWVEGYGIGQSEISWVLRNPAGVEVNRDTVGFTVVQVDLTAYRPQTVPFPRTQVPDNEESAPGAGIRYNGDDDDIDGTPDVDDSIVSDEDEDDLIEVAVGALPVTSPGIEYRLSRSNKNINASQNPDKTLTLFFGTTYEYERVIDPADVVEVWVEWTNEDVGAGPAALALTVWDTVHDEPGPADSILFTPFSSVVIAFGGWSSEPLNPASGSFQIALDLYQEDGYDVHAYNERTMEEQPPYPAYDEAVSAIQNRGINYVAIFGNSYGGGATYLLAKHLDDNKAQIGQFQILYTAYMDAIQWNTWLAPAEVRRPRLSQYHVNYYQTKNTPHGAQGENSDFDLNVTTTPWGATLEHRTMDNDATVRERIKDGSEGGGIEGPHDGLTDRVPR